MKNKVRALPRMRLALIRCGLLIGGCLLGLALVEAWLRLTIPPYGVDLFAYDSQSNRSRVMRAGYSGMCYGVPIAINQDGFRDAAADMRLGAKPDGVKRVVVLGDSFTLCAGVPWEDLYTTRLRKRSKGTVQVINLGVAGHNLLHSKHTLEEVGMDLQPDALVVASYIHNDFQMEDYRRHERFARGFIPTNQPSRQPEALYLTAVVEPVVWRARNAIGQFMPIRKDEKPFVGIPDFGPGSDGWQENWGALLEINRIAGARGIPWVMVLLPDTSNFDKQQQRHQLVYETALSNNIPCIDLLPVFAKSGRSGRAYRLNLIDSHPNALYHKVVADSLKPGIESMLSRGRTPEDAAGVQTLKTRP